MNFISRLLGQALIALAWILTAVRANWIGAEPIPKKRIYYANHTSNADFVLIWSALPPNIRYETRPVAGSDYWLKNKFRAFIVNRIFNAVLVDRRAEHRTEDPIATMVSALDGGSSIIIFPEGKRNMTTDPLLEFKAGIYNIALQRPDVELVPVWIENINSVLPKGELLPVPLQCQVDFGTPMTIEDGESKDAFLERARQGILAMVREK